MLLVSIKFHSSASMNGFMFFATLENLSIVSNGSTLANEWFILFHDIRDNKLQGLSTSTHTQKIWFICSLLSYRNI
jgi:hypothetical protein